MIESERLDSLVTAMRNAADILASPASRPGALELRLRPLCETLAELLADPDQVLHVAVACDGDCPAALHGVVVRAALELVGNAVKHGFYQRLVGRVRVDLASTARGTRLIVADDGWGLGCRPEDGEGLRLLRAAVAPLGGSLALRGGDGVTAEVFLPGAGAGFSTADGAGTRYLVH